MPKLDGVLETALYVDDMERARNFYDRIFQFEPMFADERLCAYAIGRDAFLLFARGASAEPVHMKIGTIPAHDGRGPLHMAFAIPATELPDWEAHLARHEIEIEGRVKWPRGGASIYFRDPDGNLLELATPGLWENY